MTNDGQQRAFYEMDAFLQQGLEFEALILAAAQGIREKSKNHYGADLLDARLLLVSALAHVIKAKNGQPGKTSPTISDRLALVAVFAQGLPAIEALISEGQYAKAAAAMKQDYEIVARIREIEKGRAKRGVQPNVSVMDQEVRRYYGELNSIAHPAREDLLSGLLARMESGEIRGVSAIPHFQPETALGLYELHLYTLVEVTREAIQLFLEMYPNDQGLILSAIVGFTSAGSRLVNAGFISRLDAATLKDSGTGPAPVSSDGPQAARGNDQRIADDPLDQ